MRLRSDESITAEAGLIGPAQTSRPDAPEDGRPHRRTIVIRIPSLRPLGPLAIALLLVAACTGGGAGPSVATLVDPSSSPSPSASVDPEQAMLAFARCMREHGVDIPDPQPGTGGKGGDFNFRVGTTGKAADKDKLQQADSACRHFIEGIGSGPNGGKMDPATQDALIAFSKCMREHGIDMPDPQFSDGGAAVVLPNGDKPAFDPSSQKFKDAQEACKNLLPGGGELNSGGGPGSDSGPGNNGSGGDGGSTSGGPSTVTQP